MIDAQSFSRWVRVFGERIGKPLSTDTAAAYYVSLSAELDTDQFETAMQRVFRDHVYATWPSPREIIASVQPPETLALDAAKAWTAIENVLRLRPSGARIADVRTWIVRDAGESAAATFDAIGGLGRYGSANDWRLDWMRTEFLDRFEDVSKAGVAPALRSATTRQLGPAQDGPESLSSILARGGRA